MKIKLTTAVGGDWNFGATHIATAPDDIPEHIAADWLVAGVAVPHDDEARDVLAAIRSAAAVIAEEPTAEPEVEAPSDDAEEAGDGEESAKDRKNRIAREKRAAEKAAGEEDAE